MTARPITLAALAERLAAGFERVNDNLERGAKRMDRYEEHHAQDLKDLRVELAGAIRRLEEAQAAIRADIDALTKLKNQAQGGLAVIAFVFSMIGAVAGAWIKTLFNPD
jgi:hypothetical protein